MRRQSIIMIMLGLVSLSLGACASTSEPHGDLAYDPWEGTNRQIFAFNEGVDHYVAEPASRVYGGVTTPWIRRRFTDFFDNLRTPVWFINDTLQGDFPDAGRQVARFSINTTIGLAGLFDLAESEFELEKESEDFGQTLATWGVAEGPYVMLPVFGPSTLRDAPARLVDLAFDPLRWSQFEGDDAVRTTRTVTSILGGRLRADEALERIRTSPEPYVALRSSYLQNRRGAIDESDDPYADLPDFE